MIASRCVAAAVAGLTAAAGFAASAASGAAFPLACRLVLPARAKVGAPVPLRFELSNRGTRDVRVLRWNTPLEGWFGNYLSVAGASGELPYTGPQVKRGAPAPGDYIRIRPGKSVVAAVDLAQVYALAPGEYRVTFTGRLHDVTENLPGPERSSATLSCPAANVRIE
jgi:hypothetical protein